MTNHRLDRARWGRWVASFIGFPLAGLAAKAATGPIDSTNAAVVGGLAAGAALGTIQAIALNTSNQRRVAWAAATSAGFSIGLALGATFVDFSTDTASLAMMGLLTGALIGPAQALVLDDGPIRRLVWAASTPVVWALGWAITAQVISDTDAQYANFGASGALVATIIGGLILATEPASETAAPNSRKSLHMSDPIARPVIIGARSRIKRITRWRGLS